MRGPMDRSMRALTCAAALAVAVSGCGETAKGMRNSRKTPVDAASLNSLEGTRRALEGSWDLVSLDVVDAQGKHTRVKASGRLTYDAFGTMKILGVVNDPQMRQRLTLDYEGRIVIDTTRLEFRAMDLVTDREVDPSQIAPVSPDKVRRYVLAGDSFVVTYVDASSKPTAIASWRRVPK